MLFVPKLEAVNCPFAFNRNHPFSFDIKNLSKTLINAAKKYPHLADLAEGTFEKDASCILRMYADGSKNTESEIYCPFYPVGNYLSGRRKTTSFVLTAVIKTASTTDFMQLRVFHT